MDALTPDLVGFRAAQERKRAAFGEDVRFLWPAVRAYPAGTALNGEGEPLDPTAVPDSVVQPEVTRKVGVAQGIGTIQRLSRESVQSAAGRFERAEVMAICDLGLQSQLEGAVVFERLSTGERYEIVGDRVDGVGPPDRYLVYGREEGAA